jgi:hypothetical protein
LQWTLLLACLCTSSLSLPQGAAPSAVSESTVKAAFLYKFAGYVEWPDALTGAAAAPITIGVVGGSAFAQELAQMTQGRTVSDRPISVRRLAEGETLEDLHILFIEQEENTRLHALLAAARGRPILIVTESEGALSDGSIINFTIDEQRVRFEVSLYAAQLSQLRLNSRLLAVARQVYRVPE